MKISLCGDLHTRTPPPLPPCNLGIVVGDIGYGFYKYGVFPRQTVDFIENGWKSIRGNHDNLLYAKDDPNYLGDYGYLEEYDLFFLSGAWSIDWQRRTPGVNWWEDEELSASQLEDAIALYAEKKPKIMVAHELPFSLVQECLIDMGPKAIFGTNPAITRTTMALQRMFEIHQPRHQFAGHYHYSWFKQVGNTSFRVLDCGEVVTLEI